MIALGQRILGYTLEEVIGEGGMATIYRATNSLGKTKAIKILKPEFIRDPQVRRRFHQEARIMVQLGEHTSHICLVDDLDITEDYVALIMEYLHGQNLATYLRVHGPVSVEQLIKWVEPVLLAVGYAHKQNVVHRDIKPANLHLMPNGQIKVLDFGIAKVLTSGDDFTRTQQIIGSPRYMSPEQILTPKLVDHRSDIYSLGVTMWVLLTGRRPFDGQADTNSDFMIQSRIVNDTLPLLEGQAAVLNPIIQKATTKNVNERYQNCQLLAEDLTNAPISSVTTNRSQNYTDDLEQTKIIPALPTLISESQSNDLSRNPSHVERQELVTLEEIDISQNEAIIPTTVGKRKQTLAYKIKTLWLLNNILITLTTLGIVILFFSDLDNANQGQNLISVIRDSLIPCVATLLLIYHLSVFEGYRKDEIIYWILYCRLGFGVITFIGSLLSNNWMIASPSIFLLILDSRLYFILRKSTNYSGLIKTVAFINILYWFLILGFSKIIALITGPFAEIPIANYFVVLLSFVPSLFLYAMNNKALRLYKSGKVLPESAW